ncbi:MAG: hypothetical protein BEU00_02290 [Marine Group III euryarchaeote CG-Epi3]|uniref:Uncharacterized protein n=1 Tax=Marine Group III euryarchaeote CG-Epi3 TaxID=1888997 RepID=A0A1J5UGS8_9ARCH|nr:MAG: hypothetical protein BEU00_02290 [Marine Group III euryarchaeote CG-Epi3]
MNRLILFRMLQEEIRLNTSFASGKGFYSFPLLVLITGLLAVIFTEVMINDMGYRDYLEILHITAIFYGLFAGSLAFFGNEFLERIFGYFGLILGLSSTQPITQRKITFLYFSKEIIFYTLFTMIPALLGAIIGSYFTNINIINMLTFSFTLYISFCMGISFSYYISSFYRTSMTQTVISAIVFVCLYSLLFRGSEITGGLEWYLEREIKWLISGFAIPLILSFIATINIKEHNSTSSINIIGYKNRFEEYCQKYSWAKVVGVPGIIAKERIDLERSKTGTKMFFSFLFPLGFLTFMNWFLDKGLPIQIDFNTIFYGVMIGFFGTMLYSWLNSIDTPHFYATLPIQVSDVIRARLFLFGTITWWIPLVFMAIISYMSDELSLLPIGLIVMITVGIYIVNYTAMSTGLKTNSALFDAFVFIKFFLISVPPMIAMTILSLAINHRPSTILVALSVICGILSLLSLTFYKRIDSKWLNESFD